MAKDITGQQFGFLTVSRQLTAYSKESGYYYWECICKCGNIVKVTNTHIKKGRSCGCQSRIRHSTPAHPSRSYQLINGTLPELGVWYSMKTRCNNSTHPTYINYGKRGIKVCERWLESFDNFYADMGKRPSSKHSIDRIDVNGNYEPNNCRWATIDVQSRNKRNSIRNDI